MNWLSVASIILVGLLLVGFFLGFARSWKKSLVRFGIIVGCVLASILLTNVFSNMIMNNYVNGLVVTIFGFSVDFESLAVEVLGDSSFVADLFGANSITTKVATAFMNVVVNLLVYIVIFVILFLISFIIYGIVSIIVTIKKRGDKENAKPIKIWERFIGGGIGVFGILLMCLVLFTPIFGVMSVCNEFIEKENKTVSAYNAPAYVAAGLYYQDNKSVEKVESYINKYTQLKKDYDKSFAGIVFKYTGTDFFGRAAFGKLTKVQCEGLTFDFVPECVSIIKTYNQYKKTFVQDKFELSKDESVENLKTLYSLTKDSEVMRSYVVELVPKFSEKWLNNQKYFGMEYPIKGEVGEVSKRMLNVFNTSSYGQIDENIGVVFEVVEIANKHGAIKDYENGVGFEKIITNSDTLVRDEIIAMSKSARFRRELPGMMIEMMEVEYNKSLGDATGKFSEPSVDVDKVDWNKEADIMQFISTNMFKYYLDAKENQNNNAIRDNFTEIGKAIDMARQSAIIADSFKVCITDYIKSSKFSAKESVKTYALELIEENWNDPTYRFEDSFSAIEETAVMVDGLKEMDFAGMKETLTNIVKNENSKEALKHAVQNGVIEDLAGGNQTKADVMNELLLSFVEIPSNSETTNTDIDATIKAGNEISDLVDAAGTESKEFVYEGETEEEKKADSVQMMENIAGSKTVMNAISKDNSAAALAIDELVIDADITEYGIDNADITEDEKQVLRKFFNLV